MARLLFLIVAALLSSLQSTSQVFYNIAEQQGIDITVDDNPYGGGVSFYDFNDDGWDDLTFSQTNGYIEVYLNQSGAFQQLPIEIYGYGKTKHMLWVDFDNDGDSDLLITADMSPLRLYENTGNLNMVAITDQSGLSQELAHTHGASFGDYNNDGFLDLYLSNYETIGDIQNPADYHKLNKLYLNNGDGTFTDQTLEAGVEDGFTMSFGSVWIDYNKDGWQDLYVINDKTDSNTLFLNNGDETFTDVSTISLSGIVIDAMTATVGDYNNDSELDIYITNTPGGNKLLRGNPGDSFTDVSDSSGDMLDGYSWGAVWIDYDNNGFEDLYVATYNPGLPPQENAFFINDGNSSFTSSSNTFSTGNVANSVCPAIGDFNNDGASDIVVHNLEPSEALIWKNVGTENNFIKVSIERVVSNRDGIGSWITVFCDGEMYTKYTMCGQNYLGQDSQHKIFGLGAHTTVDSIKVEWLSGIEDVLYNVEANQSISIVEGSTITAEIEVSGSSEICPGDSTTLSIGNWDSVEWSTGSSASEIHVFETGNYFAVVEANGLVYYTDTIAIDVLPPPAVTPSVEYVSCFGASDGTVEISNNNGTGIDTVLWLNSNYTGLVANDLAAGFYQIQLTDLNGCSLQSAFEITQPEEVSYELTTTPSTESQGGSASITLLEGGTPPYSIFWSNGVQNTTAVESLIEGNYYVEIEDSNGCLDTSQFFISTITGILEEGGRSFSIFPNPASKNIFIQHAEPDITVEILTTDGRLLLKEHFTDVYPAEIRVDQLAAGIYFLRIHSIYNNQTLRLKVQ
jgi:hypothetical protein